MSGDQKTILFTGALHPGAEPESVVAEMASRLRITSEQAHKIVDSGKPRKLKRGLTADQAKAYQKVLEGLGLKTEIVDDAAAIEANTTTAAPAVAPPEEVTDTAVAEPEDPQVTQSDPQVVTDRVFSSEPLLSDTWFSPGIWGWIILVGVGLLVAASALIEALIVEDETIPIDASTLNAGAWALGSVLAVALVAYFLGWIVWLLGKRRPRGGQIVFCLMVLVLGAGAVWINAERLLGKINHSADQRTSLIEVQSAFAALLTERSSAYNTAAERLQLNVGAINQRRRIDEMRVTLAMFLETSTKLGNIQLEGDKILAAHLAKAGVDAHLVERFLNDYRLSARTNQSFNSATRQYEAEVVDIWLNMLDLLDSNWGRWQPDPHNASIRTDDNDLQQSYNALVERLGKAHRNAPQASTS